MGTYSQKLSSDYSSHRDSFTATDGEVFSHLKTIRLEGKTILDYGCGDGTYAFKFLNENPSRIIGIDTSPAMIELAKKRTNPTEKDKIDFILTKEGPLPFDDETFDLIFSNFVFHHISDTAAVFQEARRVLKSGGVLIGTMTSISLSRGSEYLENTEIPIRLGTGPDSVLISTLIKPFENIQKEMQQAGFTVISYKPIENADARIDESYPHMNKTKKMTSFFLAQK